MRTIKRIFVHCTASSQRITLTDLWNEFKRKGWKNPGYHYVVFPNGTIQQLVEDIVVANGVKGYNSTGIHVAYVGGIDEKGAATDNRTPEQREALVRVLRMLSKRYPEAVIMGHRDISPDKNHNGIVDPWERIKECPCFDAKVEYRTLNQPES